MKKQSKRPSKKCAALSSWLDALAKIAADLAPVPTSVEGFFLDPDFRNLSVELPPQSLVDAALQEADGSHREELTRRAERLEGDYIRFASARSKWREEVADPIRAKRGELGELADPVGKLRTFRRNVCDDVASLTGLLKPKRTSPLYPTDEKAIEILSEGVKRRKRDKHKGASCLDIALSLLEQERKNGTRPYYPRMMNMKPDNCVILPSNNERVKKAAENWGKYISYYANRDPK